MTPAVLALIDGAPVLRPSADNLQKVINTRALILFDPSKKMYYMALMDGWVEAPTVEGPWNPAKHEPTKQLDKIRQAAETNNQNQPLGNPQQSLEDAYKDGEMPAIYVSTTPAELLVVEGEPQYSQRFRAQRCRTSPTRAATSSWTPPTTLTTSCFPDAGSPRPRCRTVRGPTFRARAFPSTSARSRSTARRLTCWFRFRERPQAKEAVIANSIPQTATISRSSATLTVTYEGAPVFQPIAGTSMTYAVNSAIPVIYVPGNTYYAVNNGVWFIVGGRHRAVGGSDIGTVGDLHHPAELARALRDLRSGLRIHTERGLCRLHAGLLRHGGLVRWRRRLWHRLLLSAIHRPDGLGARTVHLRRRRDLRLEHHRRMGARLRHGHGHRIMVQSMVGTGRLLGMGLGSSGLGMGRMGRRRRRQRLRPLGQHGLRGHARGMGESLDRQRRHRGSRNVLQPGHRQQRLRGSWRELQRLHRQLLHRLACERLQPVHRKSLCGRRRLGQQCIHRQLRGRCAWHGLQPAAPESCTAALRE